MECALAAVNTATAATAAHLGDSPSGRTQTFAITDGGEHPAAETGELAPLMGALLLSNRFGPLAEEENTINLTFG